MRGSVVEGDDQHIAEAKPSRQTSNERERSHSSRLANVMSESKKASPPRWRSGWPGGVGWWHVELECRDRIAISVEREDGKFLVRDGDGTGLLVASLRDRDSLLAMEQCWGRVSGSYGPIPRHRFRKRRTHGQG